MIRKTVINKIGAINSLAFIYPLKKKDLTRKL